MAAIKLLETFSVSRVRGGRVLTTLFHITSSWPVPKKRESEAREGTEEKYIITIIYFKIRPQKGIPPYCFILLKERVQSGKKRKTNFK